MVKTPQPKTLAYLWEADREILPSYLVSCTATLVALLDRDQCLLDCNQGFLRILELSAKPLGHNLQEFLSIESRNALTGFPDPGVYRQMRLNFLVPAGLHILNVHVFGTLWGAVIFGEKPLPTSGEILAKISVLNNEMANLNRELQKKNRALNRANATITELMRTDPLTGLANRRFFMEILEKEISLARRHRAPLSLIMVDLDHFKKINDAYGHDQGDEVLKAFAALLQRHTRKEDLPARFGGEEFILILPHADLINALATAERVRQEQEAVLLPGIGIRVTASFGVSQFISTDDLESLIKRADEALYAAKASGRNRVVGAPMPVETDYQHSS